MGERQPDKGGDGVMRGDRIAATGWVSRDEMVRGDRIKRARVKRRSDPAGPGYRGHG
jgi:hypothetical protein